jgi:tetratricopeptide (TPR) repeat protein
MIGTEGNPYPGARPFELRDYDRFFGRRNDSTSLAEIWQTNRLTFAVGPAACGKTSLLQAGVLPLIKNMRSELLPVGCVSYGPTFPFAALLEHNLYTLALLQSWSPSETAADLAGLTVGDFVRRHTERHSGAILAAIDQTEELFADSGPRQWYRRRFLNELVDALRKEPHLHLLVIVRDEAADAILDVLGSGVRYQVASLTRQGAVEAVEEPIAGTSRRYESGAAEMIVTDLQTSRVVPAAGDERFVTDDGVEPALLQIVCHRLWNSLPKDIDVIVGSAVRRYGGADTALASHFGQVIASVADDHDIPTARLRSWLIDTFVTELGTRGTAYEGATTTHGMPNAVVRALGDMHLLSAARRSGVRWYELLNDRVIMPLRESGDERPPPPEPAFYLRAAGKALTLGELDLAERYTESALRTSPGADFRLSAEANSLLGNIAYEREKPAEAETCYRTSASRFQAVADAGAAALQLAAAGQMLLAQGRTTEAVAELRAAVARRPHDLMVQTELALALWYLGQGRAAVAILIGVLGIDGRNPAALRARGEILADLGDARAAMLDLNRVMLGGRPSTRAARGLALAELSDHAAANREIDEAITEAPQNGLVLLYAARAMALGDAMTTAAELARRAVDATDPALGPHHREVAFRLIGSGE